MIETPDSLFANLTEQLLWDLPQEPETRVVNLAAVAIGVFQSRSLQVGQVVARSPLEASRDALKKRVQRFLKNPGVQVEVYQFPLVQRILGRIVAGGRRVLLILDRTEWDAFNILYVSVGWRGRALPDGRGSGARLSPESHRRTGEKPVAGHRGQSTGERSGRRFRMGRAEPHRRGDVGVRHTDPAACAAAATSGSNMKPKQAPSSLASSIGWRSEISSPQARAMFLIATVRFRTSNVRSGICSMHPRLSTNTRRPPPFTMTSVIAGSTRRSSIGFRNGRMRSRLLISRPVPGDRNSSSARRGSAASDSSTAAGAD